MIDQRKSGDLRDKSIKTMIETFLCFMKAVVELGV